MQKIVPIYKPTGLTPFEMVKKIKLTNTKLANIKIGYAGRLDPLAHGVLLLMVGEETKKRDLYLALPKSYLFEVVFGLETDTYDILGLLSTVRSKRTSKNVNLFVNTFVKNRLGKQIQKYPPYSSKAVNGKPLFWWAKNGKLTQIKIPTREIEIYEFTVISIGEIVIDKLNERVSDAINSVKGDFRQKKIKKLWDQYFSQQKKEKTLTTVTFKINCSSGTYVRELVNQMGKEIGCGALAINILRTSVGNYSLTDAQKNAA
jgi:tRNA pseudouridine55 synthase